MEKLQNLKHCPWISDEFSLEELLQQHTQSLRATFECHPAKVGWQEACRSFFSEHVSGPDDDLTCEAGSTKPSLDDLCSLEQMEQDCGIDLLTVPNELPASDKLDDATTIAGRMPPNWFEGAFCDGAIPEGGGDRLLTLYHQAAELTKRNSVGDYASLRYRTLKYFNTVRLPQEINEAPMSSEFLDDVIINVRIQRPYFRKLHFKKSCNKFPAHSQELLLRGSQHLTSLRDVIECVNDFAVNEDLASTPNWDVVATCTRAKEQFPSGMFYINGTFYVDTRLEGCKDYSVSLIKWAKRFPEIGELQTARMEETRFLDLKLRLGYPCLYLHQGYCEHLITFTDVRLQEKTDVKDMTRYPSSRGHATKLTVRCITCHHNLAQWVVVGFSLLSDPFAHLCDACLKLFCYDDDGRAKADFKLYAYYDEGSMQLEKLRQMEAEQRRDASSAKQVEDEDDEFDVDYGQAASSLSSLRERDTDLKPVSRQNDATLNGGCSQNNAGSNGSCSQNNAGFNGSCSQSDATLSGSFISNSASLNGSSSQNDPNLSASSNQDEANVSVNASLNYSNPLHSL